MANVQKYFETFHKEIRMDFELNKELAEKRDVIFNKIKKSLEENQMPSVSILLQGSYIMKTGVKPIEKLEHDIDIGLKFYIDKNKFTAAEVRKWVFEAIKKHTNNVDEKASCIRVSYEKGFHVDLVVYAVEKSGSDEIYNLAHKDNGWRPADPPKLLKHVESLNAKYKGTDDPLTSTTQFRRVIRYLKRWDDEAVPYESSSKPAGLAYTLLCGEYSAGPHKNGTDSNDSSMLYQIAEKVSNLSGRIQIYKPTPEYEDLFSKLSEAEMIKLKQRFKSLKEALMEADVEPSERKACKILKEQFGRDFPVPEKDDEKSILGGFSVRTEKTRIDGSRFA
ncbi:MAG: nucleotidyltransferase [Desulfobacterales bacterium]|nr:nucleotidyltransferase [Desulfobacterales bacterium]